jgi:hypothetical protein
MAICKRRNISGAVSLQKMHTTEQGGEASVLPQRIETGVYLEIR